MSLNDYVNRDAPNIPESFPITNGVYTPPKVEKQSGKEVPYIGGREDGGGKDPGTGSAAVSNQNATIGQFGTGLAALASMAMNPVGVMAMASLMNQVVDPFGLTQNKSDYIDSMAGMAEAEGMSGMGGYSPTGSEPQAGGYGFAGGEDGTGVGYAGGGQIAPQMPQMPPQAPQGPYVPSLSDLETISRPMYFAMGGAVAPDIVSPAMNRPAMYADGGGITQSGLIGGMTPGRADMVQASLEPNGYIIPADVVSAMGDGNTQAGALQLASMFGGSPEQASMADGGILAKVAHGEYYLTPDDAEAAGGSKNLNRFVKRTRSDYAKKLNRLPGPKNDG